MCMWREILSTDYEGKRFVVDGDLIEAFAYEYGRNQKEVADEFHAAPLDQCQKDWLHGWVQHHDTMLGNTVIALESENEKLRELVADLHLTADEFSKKYERPFYIDKFLFRRDHINDRMRELGIEVPA